MAGNAIAVSAATDSWQQMLLGWRVCVGTAVRASILLALSSFGSPIITKTNYVVIMNKGTNRRSKQQQ